jgi:hypothetical protein
LHVNADVFKREFDRRIAAAHIELVSLATFVRDAQVLGLARSLNVNSRQFFVGDLRECDGHIGGGEDDAEGLVEEVT